MTSKQNFVGVRGRKFQRENLKFMSDHKCTDFPKKLYDRSEHKLK